MTLQPIYTPNNTYPIHKLAFDWTGWFKPSYPTQEDIRTAIEACRKAWLKDGIKPENFHFKSNILQILTLNEVGVDPISFSQRIKGRLQYALRQIGLRDSFRRKLSVRTLGDNTRNIVEKYIRSQAGKSNYVDPRFKRFLGNFTLSDSSIHLKEASHTISGRYWYNLHLVIVVADRRCPVTRNDNFTKLYDTCAAIAQKKGYKISHLSIMPDHIHAAIRGAVDHSPESIALGFMNNLSYVMGYNQCWSREYYVGTFSEYSIEKLQGETL